MIEPVSVLGLEKQKQLNGSTGVAKSYDVAKGRYRVRLFSEDDHRVAGGGGSSAAPSGGAPSAAAAAAAAEDEGSEDDLPNLDDDETSQQPATKTAPVNPSLGEPTGQVRAGHVLVTVGQTNPRESTRRLVLAPPTPVTPLMISNPPPTGVHLQTTEPASAPSGGRSPPQA